MGTETGTITWVYAGVSKTTQAFTIVATCPVLNIANVARLVDMTHIAPVTFGSGVKVLKHDNTNTAAATTQYLAKPSTHAQCGLGFVLLEGGATPTDTTTWASIDTDGSISVDVDVPATRATF